MGMARLNSHTQATPFSASVRLSAFAVPSSDGIVQLLQPNVATARELLFIQYERQGAVCQLYFQLFPVKAKPCHCSAVSASVFCPSTPCRHQHLLERIEVGSLASFV